MNKPIASEAATIANEIFSAFSGVAKPPSVPVTTISNEDADEIIDHIFRFTDDVKNFYLPQILALTLCSEMEESRRKERIERIVDLLDVGVEENSSDPDFDPLMRQVRIQIFSSYSLAQSRAIYHWLEFARANYDCAYKQELDSAVNYWRSRASVNA